MQKHHSNYAEIGSEMISMFHWVTLDFLRKTNVVQIHEFRLWSRMDQWFWWCLYDWSPQPFDKYTRMNTSSPSTFVPQAILTVLLRAVLRRYLSSSGIKIILVRKHVSSCDLLPRHTEIARESTNSNSFFSSSRSRLFYRDRYIYSSFRKQTDAYSLNTCRIFIYVPMV